MAGIFKLNGAVIKTAAIKGEKIRIKVKSSDSDLQKITRAYAGKTLSFQWSEIVLLIITRIIFR